MEAADKAGQFGFYQGEVWYGGDDKSGKGVALLTKSKTTDCAQYVFKILNWSSNESKPEENLSSLAGKWGSYSWMQDRVGAFLIIRSLGGNQYFGTFYTQTYHFIKKNNVKVTNYIISDRIGYLNYMTKAQIHEILKDGLVELGSHTLTHPDLTSLSQEELKRQLSKSKVDLEKEFGVSIKSFCYPYGYYVPSIIPFVKEAGYDNAVTTKEGTIYNIDNKFEIKRFRAVLS